LDGQIFIREKTVHYGGGGGGLGEGKRGRGSVI
jgi:hypothetical protein